MTQSSKWLATWWFTAASSPLNTLHTGQVTSLPSAEGTLSEKGEMESAVVDEAPETVEAPFRPPLPLRPPSPSLVFYPSSPPLPLLAIHLIAHMFFSGGKPQITVDPIIIITLIIIIITANAYFTPVKPTTVR